jgi:hypothetical protein
MIAGGLEFDRSPENPRYGFQSVAVSRTQSSANIEFVVVK